MDTLIDRFSRKEEVSIDINGVCNNEGILTQVLTLPVKLNREVTHKVALVSLEGTAFFPNLTTESNKFYYNNGLEERSIILPEGAYDIEDYNKRIQKSLELRGDNKNNITITLCVATGKTEIELKGGYEVYFSRNNTWRKCLGFDSVNLQLMVYIQVIM